MNSQMLSNETTDPVTELIRLVESLRERPGKAGSPEGAAPFLTLIAQSLGIDANSPEMFDVLGAINHRLASLNRFIATVQDQFATSRTRPIAQDALSSVSSAFAAGAMVDAWQNVRSGQFAEKNLASLETFAHIALKHRPLRKLSDADRDNLRNQIAALQKSLDEDSGLPDWALAVMTEAFKRLSFILDHLLYFGHEAVINEVTLMRARTASLNLRLAASEPTKFRGGVEALFRALEVIVVVGHAFCLPADVPHAWHTYHHFLTGPVEEDYAEGLQRRLPAPRSEPQAAEESEAI